jgi:hypothetical protein
VIDGRRRLTRSAPGRESRRPNRVSTGGMVTAPTVRVDLVVLVLHGFVGRKWRPDLHLAPTSMLTQITTMNADDAPGQFIVGRPQDDQRAHKDHGCGDRRSARRIDAYQRPCHAPTSCGLRVRLRGKAPACRPRKGGDGLRGRHRTQWRRAIGQRQSITASALNCDSAEAGTAYRGRSDRTRLDRSRASHTGVQRPSAIY